MRYLRNLSRRPVRTVLTILGITIGIWALVVFGSMANKINALVEGGSGYYEDKITVADASGQLGGFASAPISLAVADRIRAVEGVDVVDSAVMMLMDDNASAVTMGASGFLSSWPSMARNSSLARLALSASRLASLNPSSIRTRSVTSTMAPTMRIALPLAPRRTSVVSSTDRHDPSAWRMR